MRGLAPLLVLALITTGCLRVGPGEDLHFVCEEKSGSPRKAYGIDFLLARTDIDPNVPPDLRDALLEAARQHIVTPAGRPHDTFNATLRPAGDPHATSYRFLATGTWPESPSDEYDVPLETREGRVESGVIMAPRTLQDAAARAINGTPDLAPRFGEWHITGATWDPALPSCVSTSLQTSTGGQPTVVVNVAQGRVVHVTG